MDCVQAFWKGLIKSSSVTQRVSNSEHQSENLERSGEKRCGNTPVANIILNVYVCHRASFIFRLFPSAGWSHARADVVNSVSFPFRDHYTPHRQRNFHPRSHFTCAAATSRMKSCVYIYPLCAPRFALSHLRLLFWFRSLLSFVFGPLFRSRLNASN